MNNNRLIFDKARDYLLSFPEISEEILNRQLAFPELNKPKTKSELFKNMINHAKNRQRMPNAIGNIDNLNSYLYNFDPGEVINNYKSWEEIFDCIKKNYTPPGRMEKDNPHNYWVIFCKAIISIAKYLSKFGTINEFYSYVNQFITNTPDTRLALPLILKEEIFGYQFALSCDFIKENISPLFIKPDTHIKDIFIGLGLSEKGSSDYQIFRDVINFSESINELPYTVDKLFWLIGSGNFYYEKIQIQSNKLHFIDIINKIRS